MSTQKETIVLTGATGNLGAVTLEHLLPLGHTVDLILRNGNKAIPHFEAKFPEAVASGQLTFTSVFGLAGPGVFDGPAAKATAIIHLATPLASSNIEEEMIKPTWEIDLGVLEAAKKSKTVKRVVICGTILQAMRLDELQDVNLTVREDRYNDITLDEATQGIIPGYQYAKTNAEKKVWEWVKQHESNGGLGFDVVMLLPPSIIGRSPQMGWKPSADALGGNGSVYRALFAGLGEEAVGSAFPIIM
jgi:NADPH-dependent methylglyoxal reductase